MLQTASIKGSRGICGMSQSPGHHVSSVRTGSSEVRTSEEHRRARLAARPEFHPPEIGARATITDGTFSESDEADSSLPLRKPPLVSVIIPTFNRARLVSQSIESVIAQTYANLEVLVIDDGSTDATQAVVSSIDDRRIRYIEQENRGVSSARNHGVEVSRGELVAFLDSDDLWERRKIEQQVRLFSNQKTGWAYCNVRFFGTPKVEKYDSLFTYIAPARGMILGDLFMRPRILLSSLIVRRSCLEQIGGFNESYSYAEDQDLFLRLASVFEADYVDEVLCAYRSPSDGEHDKSEPKGVRWFERSTVELADRRNKILSEALTLNPSLKVDLTRVEMKKSFHKPALKLARYHLALGHRKRTRELIRPCLKFDPLWTRAWFTLLLSYSPFGPLMLRKWWASRQRASEKPGSINRWD